MDEKKGEELLYWSLSGVLEVKYDPDRVWYEKMDKNGKKCMQWNVAQMHFLDLQRLYAFWTAGLTTVYSHFLNVQLDIILHTSRLLSHVCNSM